MGESSILDIRSHSQSARPRSFVESGKNNISSLFCRVFHDICCWVPDPLAIDFSSLIKLLAIKLSIYK